MKKRYVVVACSVLYRELALCAAKSKSIIELVFQRQSLHNEGKEIMPLELQKVLDSIDQTKYDAILLGYGLCSYGIRGLYADIPIVVPRAHDCITLIMGSKEAYRDYFDSNSGTSYTSSGWLERIERPGTADSNQLGTDGMGSSNIRTATYAEYVEEYGEEAAEYLMKALGGGSLKHYNKLAFINTGAGDIEADRETSIRNATRNGWEFEEIEGSTNLLQRMLDGDWDDGDFLVLQPGFSIEPSYEDGIIKPFPTT
jgi:Protein of unknown function (DUF1638).